ncbi:hypothetical protein [Desertibacillus haloalkaliphilus]|nr:hypothetical protein [Desertibacillus haloalkaliphilus]MBU8908184.1 hypothetical protein [Desertibacillus haloalkaliphilus]
MRALYTEEIAVCFNSEVINTLCQLADRYEDDEFKEMLLHTMRNSCDLTS